MLPPGRPNVCRGATREIGAVCTTPPPIAGARDSPRRMLRHHRSRPRVRPRRAVPARRSGQSNDAKANRFARGLIDPSREDRAISFTTRRHVTRPALAAGPAGCRVPVTGPATGRGFGRASERRVWNMARLRRRVRLSTWQAQRHAHDPRRTAPRQSRRCHQPAPSRRQHGRRLAGRTWCATSAAAGGAPMSAVALRALGVAPNASTRSQRSSQGC